VLNIYKANCHSTYTHSIPPPPLSMQVQD